MQTTPTSTLAQIEEVVRDILGDDTICLTPDTAKADVEGWDSLANVSIIFSLEEVFNTRLGDEILTGFDTIGELVAMVDRARSAHPA